MNGYRYISFAISLVFTGEIVLAQQFQEIAAQAGLGAMRYNNGHAVADYDRDGDPDIFIVALHSFSLIDSSTWSRLMQNNGDHTFSDVTISAGFGHQYANPGDSGTEGQKMGASWGDFDNDGYPDLLLTHYRKVELYRNNGNGTFTDITNDAGIQDCYECYNSSALWWDYDKDGDLDLYISDWKEANRLYQNMGNGTFTDQTSLTNLGDQGNTWASMPIDANHDGWPDIYLANDYFRNKFYLNMNGDYFMEATTAYGLEDYGNGMGITIGDYNLDGYFDIYLTNIFEYAPNALFTAQPSGVFVNDAKEIGVDSAGWAWGTSFFDADLDGDEDLYVVNGHEYSHHRNKFFRNMWIEGSNHFIDLSAESLADGPEDGMSLTTFDYDDDGDLDMLVTNTKAPPYLYMNLLIQPDMTADKNWLKVELEGTISNRDGLGSVIKLAANGKIYQRYHIGAALLSQNLLPIHFGLGNAQTVDSLMILWPNSTEEIFYNVPANQTVRVIEQQEFITEIGQQITAIKPGHGFMVGGLIQPCPNPFDQNTYFEFHMTRAGQVILEVRNIQGELLYHSPTYHLMTGRQTVEWDGADKNGVALSTGLYMYHLLIDDLQHTGKLLIVR